MYYFLIFLKILYFNLNSYFIKNIYTLFLRHFLIFYSCVISFFCHFLCCTLHNFCIVFSTRYSKRKTRKNDVLHHFCGENPQKISAPEYFGCAEASLFVLLVHSAGSRRCFLYRLGLIRNKCFCCKNHR